MYWKAAPVRHIAFVIVPSFVLAIATPVHAEGQRAAWIHGGGSFKDQGADNWVEHSKEGTFRFRETTRCTDYVELQDGSRGIMVRLHADAMYIKGGDFREFTKFYEGRWAVSKLPAGSPARAEVLTRTAHYELYIEGAGAEDLGALLEAAHVQWKAHFGAEPKERLKVNVYTEPARYCLANGIDRFSGRKEDYAPRGYYIHDRSASFVLRAQTADWIHRARVVLLHECLHQFHDKVTRNRASPRWYIEGVAELLSWHTWDGRNLGLQVESIHPLSMRIDCVNKALENFKDGRVDLLKVVSGDLTPVNGDYGLWWAILAYARKQYPTEYGAFTKTINEANAQPVTAWRTAFTEVGPEEFAAGMFRWLSDLSKCRVERIAAAGDGLQVVDSCGQAWHVNRRGWITKAPASAAASEGKVAEVPPGQAAGKTAPDRLAWRVGTDGELYARIEQDWRRWR